MNNKNDLRMMLREALDNMWSRIRSLFVGLDDRVTALEQGGGGGGGGGGGDVNVIESISVNGTNIPPDANKNVNLTVPEDVGFYVDAQGYLCQRIRSDT